MQLARIHPVQARKAPAQVKRSDVCDGGDWMTRSACGAQRNTPALISAFSEKLWRDSHRDVEICADELNAALIICDTKMQSALNLCWVERISENENRFLLFAFSELFHLKI
ncbi:hypothetical protein TM1040_1853 [Ruegeria sp. TM1040]|uniref:hypothetical protein n=1 Tax=Ruegeria sp. (strain TM1040) TaxID=292414 RepID=UPI0000D7CF4C|nr:hypothetical protein [Ruegeria sp. TM1040]ABF64586.1 hypothetical protein TM1040_1853 [Ruegeria sp. TM1040]